MPRASRTPKADTFNFRVDTELKCAFSAATEAADKPAAQVLRDFMRAYVRARDRRSFAEEARQESRLIAEAAKNPDSDEALVMRELDILLDEVLREEPYE